MSVKKTLYLNLVDKFKNDLPQVKTFRLFNNQFTSEEMESSLNYPAVFMEFETIDYRSITGGSQNIDFQINFHVGFASLETEDLKILDLLDEIYKSIQGFCGLQRSSEQQDVNVDNVAVWNQIYTTTIVDDAANIDQNRKRVLVPILETTTELVIDPDSVNGIRSDSKII